MRIATIEIKIPATKKRSCFKNIANVFPLSESEVTEDADKTITRPRPAKAPVQPRINRYEAVGLDKKLA
jgi:hypothetical protein